MLCFSKRLMVGVHWKHIPWFLTIYEIRVKPIYRRGAIWKDRTSPTVVIRDPGLSRYCYNVKYYPSNGRGWGLYYISMLATHGCKCKSIIRGMVQKDRRLRPFCSLDFTDPVVMQSGASGWDCTSTKVLYGETSPRSSKPYPFVYNFELLENTGNP